MTKERLEKIKKVLQKRQLDLTVVFENIHDPHNVSAILRTCDAVGMYQVHLLYTHEPMPRLGKKSSASALKWIDIKKWKKPEECFGYLKKQKFQILGTALDKSSKSLYASNLSGKVAIVLGNEHRGISEESLRFCDAGLYIPMLGMIQSLNVSVAGAVILYEALRQREAQGKFHKTILPPVHLKKLLAAWQKK